MARQNVSGRANVSGRVAASGRAVIPVFQNLAQFSDDISQAGTWNTNVNAIIKANQIANPLTGLTTAGLFTDDTSNGNFHEIAQNIGAQAMQPIFYSVLVKPNANIQWIALGLQGGGVNSYFDLVNVVAGTNAGGSAFLGASIQSAGTGAFAGWFWCSIAAMISVTQAQLYTANGNGVAVYNSTSSLGYWVAHAQLVAANWRGAPQTTTNAIVNTGNIRNLP